MSTILKNNNAYIDTHNVDLWNKVAGIVNETNKKPTIVNDKSNFVIITYWWGRGNINKNTRKPCYDDTAPITTQPIKYEEMIERWEQTCRKANCNYLAVEYPKFAVSGGYQMAINAKPLFIKRALELCDGRAVVYIDGDMFVRKYPHVFDMEDYDFMARHWNIDPRSSMHYLKTQCIDSTIFETSGGIMYFNDTIGSYKLLDKWIYHTFYKTNFGKADDRILSLILGNKHFSFNLRIFLLPIEFLWLSDLYDQYLNNPRDNIIIEHPECLTTEEMAQEQGAANNREPKMYGKVVTDDIECSRFGGFFWEYILFENEKQLASFKPYINYLKSILIDDAYEAIDSDDKVKPPYYFVDYKEQYGTYKFDDETYQSIYESNRKASGIILDILKTQKLKSATPVYVMYRNYPTRTSATGRTSQRISGGNSSTSRTRAGTYIDIVTDMESNKIIYTNKVNCAIIALLKMGLEVIYVPSNESMKYIDKIYIEKSKNSDLELIFCNTNGYIVDSITIEEDTPIYFKYSRILMHILHLVTNKAEFKKTFQRVFKSSLLFLLCVRTGLFTKRINNKDRLLVSYSKSRKSAPTGRRINKSDTPVITQKSAPTVIGKAFGPQIKSNKSLFKTTFKKMMLAHLRGQHEKKTKTNK